MSYATHRDVLTYIKERRRFARQFGANESTVQGCGDELIALAKTNGGVVTPEQLVAYGSVEGRYFHKLFSLYASDAEKLAAASAVLAGVSVVISSDNVVYTINAD